jgi:hypothetical protein
MPSLGFKREFVPMIKAGLDVRALERDPYPGEDCKLQTIRPRGKRRYSVGDTLFLGVGVRTSSYERIGTATCRAVLQIQIFPRSREVLLEVRSATQSIMQQLSDEEISELAKADGFHCSASFFDFFLTQYGPDGFSGYLIKW